MDFERELRQNATYWSDTDQDIGGAGDGGTAGYLLSEEQFQAILAAHNKAVREARREEVLEHPIYYYIQDRLAELEEQGDGENEKQ